MPRDNKNEPECCNCKHWAELKGNEIRSDGLGPVGFHVLGSGRMLGRCSFPGGHRAVCRDGTDHHSHEGAATYGSGPLSFCLSFQAK